MARARALPAVCVLLLAAGAASGPPAAGEAASRAPTCPLTLTAGAGLDTERLLDRRVRRASKISRRHGCELRVVRLNGAWLPVTMDFVANRVNVAVRSDRVKRIVGVF